MCLPEHPSRYDQAQAFTGEYESIAPGGYICRIRQATESTTPNGASVLILLFDIDEGPQKGFYQRTFDRKKNGGQDAKWTGTYRQLTDGKSLSFFKGVITAIEESNNFKWNWNESSLKGKLFGGVFGEEEYRKTNGDVGISVKCTQIRSVDAIRKGVDVPKRKALKEDAYTATPPTNQEGSGFYQLNEDDEDLPF